MNPAEETSTYAPEQLSSNDAELQPPLALDELSQAARARLVRFIVTGTLNRGVTPIEVSALYADLRDDAEATRYIDGRFVLRNLPEGWRDIENRVLDLEQTAGLRGVDLNAVWRRARGVAIQGADPLEQLARLAGMRGGHGAPKTRSIFDDPDDLDVEDDGDAEAYERLPLSDRLPDLVDLTVEAQEKIRRFAIEERLEHGLPAIELLELYRVFDLGGDERARQYLDRVYVEREPPEDWLELQTEARLLLDSADSRGKDAGKVYADLLRGSPSLDPLVALRLAHEQLQLGR